MIVYDENFMEIDLFMNSINLEKKNNTSQDCSIQLLPSMDITLAKFLPDPNSPAIYYAHPKTISALKKDSWRWEEILNAPVSRCEKCQKYLHKELWRYCPHCENLHDLHA